MYELSRSNYLYTFKNKNTHQTMSNIKFKSKVNSITLVQFTVRYFNSVS
jgi:hypothetical protein